MCRQIFGRAHAAGSAQNRHCGAQMLIDSVGRYRQDPGNFLRWEVLHNQPQTIALARRQLVNSFHIESLVQREMILINHRPNFYVELFKLVMYGIIKRDDGKSRCPIGPNVGSGQTQILT